MRIVLAILLGCQTLLAVSWDCGKERWKQKPKMIDGVYQSTLAINCTIPKHEGASLDNLVDSIRETMNLRSKLNSPPVRIRADGLAGWSFDVTNSIDGSENSIRIREETQLLTDSKSKLIYRSRSKKVFATGMAGYLKSVSFSTELLCGKAKDPFKLEMTNTVRVKRPWYAIAPIFRVIAKGVSKSKFEEARTRILEYISKGLESPKRQLSSVDES